MAKLTPVTKERLLSHCKINPETGCWEWQRSLISTGYGQIQDNGKLALVHRKAYELWNGVHPGQLHVLHHCDNRKCFNPDHLFLGTESDNALDALAKGRRPFGTKMVNSKLSLEQLRTIRTTNCPPSKLAKLYGVHRQTIRDVRIGVSYKRVQT